MDIVTPEWVKDAIFYQIFPDRFAKSDKVTKPANLQPWGAEPTQNGFQGGDLIGVIEHLDYLLDLGINAIYFNPIFQSASNHRYHTHDYMRVDPILGGDEALRKLLDAAHERDIKVILDGVFNHASRGFFQFNHLLECGQESPYVDWFIAQEWPLNAYDPDAEKPNYKAWWSLPALPEFNTDTPAVRTYLWQVAEHWVKFGIDGWRLDVPGDIDDDEFWQEFRRRVKDANPEAYIVGEIWGPAQRWLKGDQFDAVMNYPLARAAIGFFGRETLTDLNHGPYEIEPLEVDEFAKTIEENIKAYDWEIAQTQLNLLGSHDTPRFLSMVGEDESALQLAMLCQLTLPGAPCIYYGDELELTGGYEPKSRGAMPWDDLEAHKGHIWQTIKEIIALRKTHRVLRRGTYETVLAEEGVIAYKRALDDEQTLIALNAGQEDFRATLPVKNISEVIYGDPANLTTNDDDEIAIQVPARGGLILM